MSNYSYPGVYVEEVPGGSRAIEAVPTSYTAFIGRAIQGPVGEAVLVKSYQDYTNIYGYIASETDTMGMSVQAFFLNGGTSAYICRLSGEGSRPPTVNDFTEFYNNILQKIRHVSIIILPGEHWAEDGSGNPIISATIKHCEEMQNRMVIFDLPPNLNLDQTTTVTQLALPSSTYSALYWPWLKVTNPNSNKTIVVAPSSTAAGVWSRIDDMQGVWKAPSGTNADIKHVSGLQFKMEDSQQKQLNQIGINCIKSIPDVGIVIWGAHTLTTMAETEWRYIPVRRTAMMIEQSIYEGIHWALFEPNDHQLWSSLRTNIGNFMHALFLVGALQGKIPSEAYFVNCGIGDTMTQVDVVVGNLIVIVGFALLKPNEFSIVRIEVRLIMD